MRETCGSGVSLLYPTELRRSPGGGTRTRDHGLRSNRNLHHARLSCLPGKQWARGRFSGEVSATLTTGRGRPLVHHALIRQALDSPVLLCGPVAARISAQLDFAALAP